MDYNHVKIEGAAVRKCYNIALTISHKKMSSFPNRDSKKTDIAFIMGSDFKVSIPGYLLRMTNCRKCFEMAEYMKVAVEEKDTTTAVS